jgi:hypothetical protein
LQAISQTFSTITEAVCRTQAKEQKMSKRELRWFTLVSFMLGAVGIVAAILVNVAHFDAIFSSFYLVSTIGTTAGLVAVLLFLTSCILAIIKLGQIRQWTWFYLLLVTLVVFFPLSTVVFLLYLFIGPDDRPALPAQSPAYLLYYPPQAPAPLPPNASQHNVQPVLPAQPYEQSLRYPPYAPTPKPHPASERPLQ